MGAAVATRIGSPLVMSSGTLAVSSTYYAHVSRFGHFCGAHADVLGCTQPSSVTKLCKAPYQDWAFEFVAGG